MRTTFIAFAALLCASLAQATLTVSGDPLETHKWVKASYNPIILPNAYGNGNAQEPEGFYYNGQWWVYWTGTFSSYNPWVGGIWLSTGQSLNALTNVFAHPVVGAGYGGAWAGNPADAVHTNIAIRCNVTGVFDSWFPTNLVWYGTNVNFVMYTTCGYGGSGDWAQMHMSQDGTNWWYCGKAYSPAGNDALIASFDVSPFNGQYCALYDCAPVGYPWSIGLAWAPSVTGPWAHATSPLSFFTNVSATTAANLNHASPRVIGNKLHMWGHGNPSGSSPPSDIYHFSSTDGTNWVVEGGSAQGFVFTKTQTWEQNDQVSDPCVFEYSGNTYMFYDKVVNSPVVTGCIGVATYSGTLASLIERRSSFYGVQTVSDVHVGTTAVSTVRSGTNVVWQRASAASDPNVTNGLAVWYKFTNGSGNTITDNSGNSKDATTYSSPTWTATNSSGYGAMTFARASSQYATVPSLSLGTNFTLSCWIYENSPSSVGYQGAICFSATGTGGRGSIICNSGATYWDWTQAIGVGIGTYVQSAWHHYAYTYNGVKWTTYYDGTQFGTANKGDGGSVGEVIDRAGVLGRYYTDYNGHYLNGQLADVRVYSRPITATEVATIYSLSGHP